MGALLKTIKLLLKNGHTETEIRRMVEHALNEARR